MSKLIKGIRRKNRLMLVVLTAIGILLIYFITSSHILHRKKSKELVLQKLRAISLTASQQIDGDAHEHIVNKYLHKNDIISSQDDSIYQSLHHQLKKIKDLNEVESPIYTMIFNEKNDEYEFIITSSDQPYYRHMFVNYPTDLRMNYDVGGVLDEYNTENGTWLSAFAPIRNSSGDVVALLQVDEKFDSFIAKANKDLIRNILVTSILFIPFMVFLYSYMKGTLDKEEQNQTLLQERNEEIEIQNELIKESNMKLEKANLIINARNESLDKQIKKRAKELIVANTDLETFLYRSSHDIQGPIASLKGVVGLAKTDAGNGGQYFNFIDDSIRQLDLRVRGINSVFELKKQELDYCGLDLQNLFNEVVREQSRILEFTNIEKYIELNNLRIIKSDKNVLQVLFSELVKNSIIFRKEECLNISITAEAIGQKHIRLIYKDNGVGIDTEQRESIFEMFKRGNEKSQGSGLGLYAVKLAVEKLHGKVELVNADDGVIFEIKLPR